MVARANFGTVSVLEEPLLRFAHRQSVDDPKQGLFMFGPLPSQSNPRTIRAGVIGTTNGLHLYRQFARAINRPVSSATIAAWSPFFPGFSEVFGSEWPHEPILEILVSPLQISEALRSGDRHQSIYDTVSLFVDPIKKRVNEDDLIVDVWFVVVPDEIHLLGRPLSRVPVGERGEVQNKSMDLRLAKRLNREPSLFEEDMEAAIPYSFDADFHHQLKVRLVGPRIVSQVVRESTLEPFRGVVGSKRRMQDLATVAWNIATSSFFKAGGRPWKLSDVREGVCYIGLTFKRKDSASHAGNACCGAQMFLDSGDGLVFKGAVGPWYSETTREFHLSETKAHELMNLVLASYVQAHGKPPREVFIHGRTRFDDSEWAGFSRATEPHAIALSGIRIRRTGTVKMFRPGRFPVVRGSLLRWSERQAFLWTSGYIPKLGTYPGWEVPNPLHIEVCRGGADIGQVSEDVFRLTKLNFNACIYGDGMPVTLRFADLVGEILTAGPDVPEAPLPFRHYI
jgi:hypothetical protein